MALTTKLLLILLGGLAAAGIQILLVQRPLLPFAIHIYYADALNEGFLRSRNGSAEFDYSWPLCTKADIEQDSSREPLACRIANPGYVAELCEGFRLVGCTTLTVHVSLLADPATRDEMVTLVRDPCAQTVLSGRRRSLNCGPHYASQEDVSDFSGPNIEVFLVPADEEGQIVDLHEAISVPVGNLFVRFLLALF